MIELRNSKTGFVRVLAILVVVSVYIGCDQPTDSDDEDSPPDAAATISSYENDTMEQEYADEWTAESSDTTFVLKDNTFLLDQGTAGPPSAGRVNRIDDSTLRLETTALYLDEEDFASVIDPTESSEINSYASLLSLYGGEFDPPQSAFTFNEWVTRDQFAQQYEETNRAYTQAYFEYIEQVYAQNGFDIDALVPEWDSLKNELAGDTSVDPTTLEGYYEEPEITYQVQEEPEQNRRRFLGNGINQDWSFISDIPTDVNYATP